MRTPSLPLVDNHQYSVDVRAVNGQGGFTSYVTSGPFLYNGTPPSSPGVTATYDGNTITVTVSPVAQLFVGLMGLQLAVGSTPTGSQIVPWQVANVSPTIGSRPSATILTFPVGRLLIGQYYVQVRVVDGVGWPSAITTMSFTVAPSMPSLPGSLGGGVIR